MKKNSLIRRAFALCLVLAAILGTNPAAFAAGSMGTGTISMTELMEKFDDSVQKPKSSSILEEPEEMEVWSKYGRLIYVYSRPAENSLYRLSEAKEGSRVTVYAKQNGWALAIVNNSRNGGWMKLGSLDTKSHDEHPSFLDLPTMPKGTYLPVREDYLENYETMYVKSKYGVRIYIIDDPRKKEKDQKIIGYAYEAEECTVLAEKAGQLFVLTENGKAGWVKAKLMVYEYPDD